MSENDGLNIRAVLEAIQKILHYTENLDNADQLHSDSKIFDACMMNFIVIGEMVARLSDDVLEKNSDIEWYKIKAFRNIVAHDYFGIDAEEVWQIIVDKLPALKIQLEEIVKNT